MYVHPVFGPVAPELGWVPAPRYLLRRSRVLRLLATVERGRLLEIGCGAGVLCQEVARLGFRRSRVPLERCRSPGGSTRR